jgi:pimeloyl-ACP methyl ester carboxylesterase
VARAFAHEHPERTIDVVLLAAGGQSPLSTEQAQTLTGIFSATARDERRALIAKGFFADPQNADVWLDGWYPAAANLQIQAALKPDIDFRLGGGRPVLIVQPADDFIAPAADAGKPLKAALGELAMYLEVGNSGHALLPEQPEVVARSVINFINKHSGDSGSEPPRCDSFTRPINKP